MTRKRIRRLLAFLLVLGIAGLTLPWWLPVAGRPVARHFGVEWEEMQTEGWRSYEIHGVQGTFGQVELAIDRMRLPQPIPWIGSRLGLLSRAMMEAENLRLTVPASGARRSEVTEPEEVPGVELLADILTALEEADEWIPDVDLKQLEIRDHHERVLLVMEELRLTGPLLTGRFPTWKRIPSLDWSLLRTETALRLTAAPVEPEPSLRLQAVLEPASPTPRARARLISKGTALEARATFQPGFWIPDSAHISGEAWPVPGALVSTGLLDTGGILADILVDYGSDAWLADIGLKGTGRLPGSQDNRVQADIDMRGNRESVEISAFQVQSGWLTAHLSDPIHYSFVDKSFSQNAKMELSMDLSQQDWMPASGFLQASTRVRASSLRRPEWEFEASGGDIKIAGFALDEIGISGQMEYPSLKLEQAQLNLGDGGDVSFAGIFNLDDTSLESEATFHLTPEWLDPFTGPVKILSPLTGTLSTHGGIHALEHKGTIKPVSIKMDGLHPLTCTFSWEGRALDSLDIPLQLESAMGNRARLILAASREEPSRLLHLTVREARHEDAAGNILLLDSPFFLELETDREHPVRSVTPFRFTGPGMYLSGQYNGIEERILLETKNLNLATLEGWMDRAFPPVVVDRFAGSVTRLTPHLEAALDLTAHSTNASFEAVTVNIKGILNSRGIFLDTIDGTLGSQSLLQGTLSLPILLHPLPDKGDRLFSAIAGGPIEGVLSANLSDEQAGEFREFPFLKVLSGVHIDLTAGGSPEFPEARLDASMERLGILRFFKPGLAGYPLEDLRLSASISPERLVLQTFTMRIKGAQVDISGTVPGNLLTQLLNRDEAAWKAFLRQADMDLSVKNFLARDFQSILPGYLRSTGQIDGKLSFRPGPGMNGNFEARDFSLRPTLYSQTVEDITFSMDVLNSRFTLSQATASIGNSLVDISGYFDLSDPDTPLFSLDISGERTPLIRTPDLLVHSDMDLHLNRIAPDQPARLTGNLHLRDSILLLDIEPLAARTTGGSLPKPPFFSITQSPFADWVLNVDIAGDEFLRFRSAYVKTTLSTQLDLTGTLSDPVWVGNIFADDGTVDFPGLRTQLSRSELFLTRERQDDLQLDFSTIGQVASYILTVSVSGTLDDPQVQFASTPELPNSKIVQLLATGSVEGSNLQNVGIYLGKSLFPAGAGENVWDRLSIQIGRDITEASKDTIDLYYQINDRWRLHGEYDKYDAQNINLEWEVFSK